MGWPKTKKNEDETSGKSFSIQEQVAHLIHTTSPILLLGKIFIGLPQNKALIIWFLCMVAVRLITSKYYVPYAFIFTD